MLNNSNLKICHVSTVHPNTDIRIYRKEVRTLAIAGFAVTWIAPNNTLEDAEVNTISLVKYSSRYARFTKGLWNLYCVLKKEKFDIIHFHDPEILLLAPFIKSKNNKLIYDAHEDTAKQILGKYWIPKILRPLISMIFEKVEFLLLKCIDCLVAATPDIELSYKQRVKNSIVVNNFPFLHELSNNISIERKQNSICYIGGISEIRGITYLLDALYLLPNVTLVLAGNIAPLSYQYKLENHPAWKQVNYVGSVDRNSIKKILAESEIGIVTLLPVPNHLKSQPIKMFEYMSASLPVIASNFPYWKSIIEENKCGICVDPTNAKEIAEGILKLLNDKNLAKEMGMNGRLSIEKKYNWENESLKLCKLYSDLILHEQ